MAFTNKSQSLFSANFSFTTIFLLLVILNNPLKPAGVTVDLIPRDASKSHFDRLQIALARSSKRASHINSVLSNNLGGSKSQTQIISGGGAYLMNLSIGTPPVTVLGIADTASDLVWTQCLPCTECYKQDLPFFDPKKSSTYKKVSCNSDPCQDLKPAICSSDGSTCGYSYYYGDGGPYTSGDLSTETVIIGNNTNSGTFKNIAFGCAHVSTAGTFGSSSSGFVGLGGGPLSLVSQLDEKKFSYCLVPFSSDSSSKISFGSDAVVSGSGAVKTPLMSKSVPLVGKIPDAFYHVTLESISVGNKKIMYKAPPDANATYDGSEGNIIIDSGTTLTYLPSEFYSDLELEVEKAISAKKVDQSNLGLRLCYAYSDDLEIPDLTARFFKGGDVKLSSSNSFVRVDEETVCFSFTDGGSDVSIYGSLVQTNFLVGYDLDAETVTFLPKDCTKA
ncbi:hypothetical protein QN277_004542 [Acacia crassicarpa]|uniref:Peptidase A1 domain-containing protein n=1 Tax=Acacia crassicarpa TaxID=499986 RepID=A0AAE1MGV0_9FABA|nr:hypothetical protein QN277_004542 [Acacia crassicarpa]